jgi:uncharacterized protein YbcI
MTFILPKEEIQVDFQQQILHAWHEAHGIDNGRVHLSWGEDRVVVIIENALFKGEQLLVQSEQGNAVFEQYVNELLAYIVEEQRSTLSRLLEREITDASFSANVQEHWVMIVFRLAE